LPLLLKKIRVTGRGIYNPFGKKKKGSIKEKNPPEKSSSPSKKRKRKGKNILS